MLRTLLLQSIVLSATIQLCAVAHGEPDSKRQPLAFVNVNVVPMDSERIIADQTVLIQDGRIRAIGSADRLPIREAVCVGSQIARASN